MTAVPPNWSKDPFDHLNVSKSWKNKFRAIEAWESARNRHTLPNETKKLINRNWPAFFFGFIYFAAKGLWRQSVTFLAFFILVFAVSAVFRTHLLIGPLLAILGAFAAFRANFGYYYKVVRASPPWI